MLNQFSDSQLQEELKCREQQKKDQANQEWANQNQEKIVAANVKLNAVNIKIQGIEAQLKNENISVKEHRALVNEKNNQEITQRYLETEIRLLTNKALHDHIASMDEGAHY